MYKTSRFQSIRSLTSINETVYLGSEIYGGNGSSPTASEARVVAWDPSDRSVIWEITPVPGTVEVHDIQLANGYIFGLAETREAVELFVVDPGAQRTVYTTEVPEGGEFTLTEDRNLYGALGEGITKIETDSFETTHYLEGFDHLGEIKSDNRENIYIVGQERYHLYQFDASDFSDGTPI